MTRARMALAAAALSAVALAACSETPADPSAGASSGAATEPASPAPSSSPAALPTGSITPSDNLDAITVSDADTPEVKVPAPWAISSTQTKVLRDSSNSQVVGDTSTVTVNYVGVNGRTGEPFDSSYTKGQPATFKLDGVIPGFKTGLAGQKVGSRVLIGMTGADGYAQGNAKAGIEAGDSLLFVVDIVSASYTEATGEAVTTADGLPAVTMTEGKPEVAIPEGGVNAEQLVVQPLIKGAGTEITAESSVSVKYRAWGAKSGKLIYDAWQPQEGKLASLIAGWKTGLLGQTAGSRVMLIVPAAESFPNGNPSMGLESGEGLVYVIDILDVKAAS